MGAPAIFVENLANLRAFPGHTLVADENTGEVFRIADGRRSILDFWTGLTTNQTRSITVTCDRLRSVNMVALDRGHNLAGKQIQLLASDDGFTTSQTVLDLVLPTVAGPGQLDNSLGVRTEEGAWLKRFPTVPAREFRLTIPAMGTGLVPQIVGLWLGLSWATPHPDLPTASGQADVLGEEAASEAGWLGRGALTERRAGGFGIRLATPFDRDVARYHLEGHYRAGRPMWLVEDDELAERSVLALVPLGPLGIRRELRWFNGEVVVPWVEHQPRRVA